MARVRAKKDVYLGEHGYRAAGEEFEYTGPENHNLEAVAKAKADSASSEADVENVPKQAKGKGK